MHFQINLIVLVFGKYQHDVILFDSFRCRQKHVFGFHSIRFVFVCPHVLNDVCDSSAEAGVFGPKAVGDKRCFVCQGVFMSLIESCRPGGLRSVIALFPLWEEYLSLF